MHGALAQIEKPKTRFAYLFVTDGLEVRCIGSNHFGPAALNHLNQWAWVVGHMVSEFGCDPDAVHCEEDDEGNEFITIDGKRVGHMEVE